MLPVVPIKQNWKLKLLTKIISALKMTMTQNLIEFKRKRETHKRHKTRKSSINHNEKKSKKKVLTKNKLNYP